ncbi:MAG: prepilin-type N-terminal cleavage/methylation domain-containing protein [Planctomycetota bacterium]
MIHRSARPRGFTLVELLVVIGIIAVLISILLPSLVRARASGQTAVCLSNQRQIGAMATMYANDYQYAMIGWFNGFNGGSLEPSEDWTNTISTYALDNPEDHWVSWGLPDNPNPAIRKQNPEIELFLCPSDADVSLNAMNPFWKIRRPATYAVPVTASSTQGVGWWHPRFPKVTVWASTEYPLMTDVVPAADAGPLNGWQWYFVGIHDEGQFATDPNQVPPNVAFRHGNVGGPDDGLYYRNDQGQAVTLFLDGHVRAVYRTDFAAINMSKTNRDVIARLKQVQ